jgi:putative phosphoribosyl transferase
MAIAMQSEQVCIQVDKVDMEGMLWLPEDCIGIVLFAHGGGSSRVRPPNDYVASVLRDTRLGTMWLDLFAAQEDRSRASHANIELLAGRLNAACDWLRKTGTTQDLPLGLYSAGNGAAVALQLAASRGGISAVVSRGGRPDLAGHSALVKVSAPTLLIVGGLDEGVVATNRSAYAALRCKKRFEIIPGATHSFEEPGSLEVVARLARSWFLQHSNSVHV